MGWNEHTDCGKSPRLHVCALFGPTVLQCNKSEIVIQFIRVLGRPTALPLPPHHPPSPPCHPFLPLPAQSD